MKRFKKKGKERGLDDEAKDDPAAADSPDPGTDNAKKPSVSSKVTNFL